MKQIKTTQLDLLSCTIDNKNRMRIPSEMYNSLKLSPSKILGLQLHYAPDNKSIYFKLRNIDLLDNLTTTITLKIDDSQRIALKNEILEILEIDPGKDKIFLKSDGIGILGGNKNTIFSILLNR